MSERRLGILMNGVTGRMGTNQHLVRSVLAIRREGGVRLKDGTRVMPDPVLVGRDREKVEGLAKAHGVERTATDLDRALADPGIAVYFDAVTTDLRVSNLKRAIAARKHIYTEKPTATSTADALALYRLAKAAGIKHGVVQDKLFLPGLVKLRRLIESGFFGRILTVKGDFGYWVFEGDWLPAQRPSWNYRKKDGGGIILDMLCHWRYVLDNLFGAVRAVSCRGMTLIDQRRDEQGRPYDADAEDAAFATFELEGGAIAQINSSWQTRVRRDDLVTFQVDGTKGSAVAGLTRCWIQPREATPKPVWNPDERRTDDFFAQWQEVPDNEPYPNGFKAQWELFIRHVCEDAPFAWDLLAGAKGVQLAELGYRSSAERRWIDVPELTG
ncbi:MAG TPA: Gfo/Idh/MocA family oxidoreductase [Stellaceae bacterium]|nr:Gfo/Idh/MocA family oxidoreductase [Stellaceae bacterium]